MRSILENFPGALEKNVYSVAFRWNDLYIFIKTIWYNVSFKASAFLSVFCLAGLSTDVSEVLKFPTIIVLLSIFPFIFVNICFMYLGAPMLGAYAFSIVISIPLSLCNVLLCLCYSLFFLSLFCPFYKYCYPTHFFLFPFVWDTFFHPLTYSLCVFRSEVGLLQAAYIWVFFFF